MGPPAEFAPIAQPALTQGSVSVKLPNGPQAFEIGKALKVAVEGDSGYALPVLPAVADKEILGLINAYLSSRGLALKVEKKGEKWAEEEQVQRQLLELVLTGKWAELVGALKVLQVRLGPQFPSLLFLAKKQEFLEVLDAQVSEGVDEQRPIPTVAHSLQALGALSSEQEFEELRQCALLPRLQDHPAYSHWTAAAGRQACSEALVRALSASLDTAEPAQTLEPSVSPGSMSTESRLEVLLRQALAFQALNAGFSVETAERLSREGGEKERGALPDLGGVGNDSIVQGKEPGVDEGTVVHVLSAETGSPGSSLDGTGLDTPTGISPEDPKESLLNGLANGAVPLEFGAAPFPGVNGRSKEEVAPSGQRQVVFTLLRDVDWSPAGTPDPFDVGMHPAAVSRGHFLEDSLKNIEGLSRATSMGGSSAGDLALPVVPRVKAKLKAERRSEEEETGLVREASARLTYPNQKRASDQVNGVSDAEGESKEKARSKEGVEERGRRGRGRELGESGGERRGEEMGRGNEKQAQRMKSEGLDLEVSDSERLLGSEPKPEGKVRKASPPLEEEVRERFGPTVVVTSKPPRASKAPVDSVAAKPSPAASPRVSDSIRGSAPPSPIKSKLLAQWSEEGGGSRKGTPKGSWSNPPSPHGDSVDPDEYDKEVRAQYEQVKALFEAERAARGDYRGERYEEVGAKYEQGKEMRGDSERGHSLDRGGSSHPRSSHHSGELEPTKVKGSLGGERLPSPKPLGGERIPSPKLSKTSPRKATKAGSPSISPKHHRSSSAEKLYEPVPAPRVLEKPISRSGPLDRIASNPSISSRAPTNLSATSTPKSQPVMTRSASFLRRASSASRSYADLDPTAGFASATVLKDTQPVRTVAWDRDGNFLAVGSNSRTLRICHVWGVTGEEPNSRSSREHKTGVPGAKVVVEERDWHMGSVYTVGWNWTGGLVATGSNDQTLKVASVQRAKAEDYGNLYFGIAGPDDIGECSFEGHDGTIRDLAFSPVAENMVLSGGAGDFGLRYWDCESGTCVSTLWGSTAAIFAMRIAPDGRTVVTGGGESSVRLWDLRTASCVRTMGQYTTQVSSLALGWESPGGPQVIAGFADGTCRVVDFGSGRETRKLTHHTADCRSVDVSPGGRWLLTGGFDGSIGIVDARTGWRVAGVYRAHGDKVIQSRWHPGGVGFATSSADRTVRVWAAAKPNDDD